MSLHQRDQDLGLSLSLGGGGGGGCTSGGPHTAAATTATTTDLMMLSSSSSGPFGFLQKLPWNTDRTFIRGIDVNRPAAAVADEEEAGVSSPNNSTVSTVSGGKRSAVDRDLSATTVGPTDDLESEEDGCDNSRKKLRLNKDQSAVLEESFKEHNTLNPKQKLALANRLGLRPRQVEVWFQNRRARTKLKQTEVDCEFLKRCCEQLTEENRRLQKEVAELRALKLSPQFYMQMAPPTTLTMCPSCERVGVPPSGPAQPGQNRGGVSRWAAPPVPIRHFEALQPRS